MVLETKYGIGDRIWVVYEHGREVTVYEDVITEITVSESGATYCGRLCPDSLEEGEIILYDDMCTLCERIRGLSNGKDEVL